nr:unnamed protein product [Callosobruchus analis]
MACQNGVFNTLAYRGKVIGMNAPDTRCRACRQAPETLMHLLSACEQTRRDIVLLCHQQNTLSFIEISGPAELNIVSKEEERWAKFQELLGQPRRLWPDHTVSLLVMVIAFPDGMRNTLLIKENERKRHRNIQKRKFEKLASTKISTPELDTKRTVVNINKRNLSEDEISVLDKGANSAITPRQIQTEDNIANLESAIQFLPEDKAQEIRTESARSKKPNHQKQSEAEGTESINSH